MITKLWQFSVNKTLNNHRKYWSSKTNGIIQQKRNSRSRLIHLLWMMFSFLLKTRLTTLVFEKQSRNTIILGNIWIDLLIDLSYLGWVSIDIFKKYKKKRIFIFFIKLLVSFSQQLYVVFFSLKSERLQVPKDLPISYMCPSWF